MGRNPKLSPETQAIIVEHIKAGNYQYVAAEAAGIDIATFHRWIERGTGEGAREPYRAFCEALTRAERESERALVGHWRLHASKDWRAARDLLARRFPERWADQRKLEVSGSLSVTDSVRQLGAQMGLTDEEMAEAEELTKGIHAEG